MVRLFGNDTTNNKLFGTLEENGVGKFNHITPVALRELKALGITHAWYTGVVEHALLTDYSAHGISADDPDVVKGRAGSPYSIKDYYDVNPDLAESVPDRLKEFEQLVERTHANGLKVIIDFVPNHVARSYRSDAKPEGVRDLGADDDVTKSFTPSNNFYYLPGESFQPPAEYAALARDIFPDKDGVFSETPAKVTGNDQFSSRPGMFDWFETVKLNYGVDIRDNRKTYFDPIPDTWSKMRDILIYWTNKHVDGFRCDMAEMVPVEFWNWAIPQVKAVNPEVMFVAEIYNPAQYRNYLANGRFDLLYDKVQLYDTLRGLITGSKNTNDIDQIQQSLSDISPHMLHFLENHDEQRIASPYFAGNPWKAIPGMVISATIDRGAVLIYFGQEVGEPATGNSGFGNLEKVGVTTMWDYWGVPEHQKWMNHGAFDGALLSEDQKRLRQLYTTLLNLAQARPAIVNGQYADLTLHNQQTNKIGDDVHAFVRYTNDDKLLMVSNFSAQKKSIRLSIPEALAAHMGLTAKTTFTGVDLLHGVERITLQNLGTQLSIPPHQAFIYHLE